MATVRHRPSSAHANKGRADVEDAIRVMNENTKVGMAARIEGPGCSANPVGARCPDEDQGDVGNRDSRRAPETARRRCRSTAGWWNRGKTGRRSSLATGRSHHHQQVFLAGGVRTAIGGFCGALGEIAAPAWATSPSRPRRAGRASRLEPWRKLFSATCSVPAWAKRRPASDHRSRLVPRRSGHDGQQSLRLRPEGPNAGRPGDPVRRSRVVVAGGTENMSYAPYLLPKARNGYRMGHGEVVDSMIKDGLWDVYNNLHMGICGDRCAEKYEFTRQDRTISPWRAISAPSALNRKGSLPRKSRRSRSLAAKARRSWTRTRNRPLQRRETPGCGRRLGRKAA